MPWALWAYVRRLVAGAQKRDKSTKMDPERRTRHNQGVLAATRCSEIVS